MKIKNKIHKVPNVALHTIIEITNRYCSDKIQKNIKVGYRYIVVKIEALRNGTPAITVRDPTKMDCKKTMRINAERFSWRIVTAEEMINEQKKREEEDKIKQAQENVKQAIDVLDDKFTRKEQENILLIPSAILEIAKYYSRLVLEQCRDSKEQIGLSQYKKESRDLTRVLKDMDEHAEESFEGNYSTLKNDVLSFITDTQTHQQNVWKFFVFENVINNEYKRIDTKSSNRILDVQTKAVCALYFLAMFERHEREVDEIIEKKLGQKPKPIVYGDVLNLRNVLAKYAKVNALGFKENQDIVNGFKSAFNVVRNIDFHIKEIKI